METKLYSKDCITLDGRMDEQVWNSVKEYTGFKMKKSSGGQVAQVQTFRLAPIPQRDKEPTQAQGRYGDHRGIQIQRQPVQTAGGDGAVSGPAGGGQQVDHTDGRQQQRQHQGHDGGFD